MARESAEGQAIELAWARKVRWDLTDRDYLRMVHKKTGWYTFLTPILIGATVADARPEHLVHLRMFAISLGAAFQIQDDILNLVANEARYGKETAGDLWEGKHTLILLHAIRSASECDRRRAISVLGKQRPAISPENGANDVLSLVRELEHAGEVTPAAGKRISDRLLSLGDAARFKTSEDVEFLSDLIRQHRSVEHASRVAHKRALRAQRSLERVNAKLPPSVHLDFLHALVDFVVERDH
jgi:geranylgeranyl diphosphate synthase type II